MGLEVGGAGGEGWVEGWVVSYYVVCCESIFEYVSTEVAEILQYCIDEPLYETLHGLQYCVVSL